MVKESISTGSEPFQPKHISDARRQTKEAGLRFVRETREISDLNRPAEVTYTPVNIDGEETNRLMLIFQSRPCTKKMRYGSCAMCPFHANANPEVQDENLVRQCIDTIARLKKVGIEMKDTPDKIAREQDIGLFDIASSGSFFCDEEFPPEVRRQILTAVASGLPDVKRIVVESRAEFLDDKGINKLKEAKELLNAVRAERGFPPVQLEYSIGIETTDPAIRNGILHKMLEMDELKHAIDLCKEGDVRYLQTYLLVKPNLIPEGFAVADAVRSAKDVLDITKERGIKCRIALEPVFVGETTVLDTLYKGGLYRPPQIWSVVEVAKQVRKYITENRIDAVVFVGLSDEGISKERLTKGCDQCDRKVKEAISKFNGSQDLADLAYECSSCQPQWERAIRAEKDAHPNVWRYVDDNIVLKEAVEDNLGRLFEWVGVSLKRFSKNDLRLMVHRKEDFPEGNEPVIDKQKGMVRFAMLSLDKMEKFLAEYYSRKAHSQAA